MGAIDYRRLIMQLDEAIQSPQRLAVELGVDRKTIKNWLSGQETAIREIHRAKIVALARQLGIEPVLTQKLEPLWDLRLPIDVNLSRPVPQPPVLAPQLPIGGELLGTTLKFPFGPSASFLTSNSCQIRYLAATGVGILTTATVLSREQKPWWPPDVFGVRELLCGERPQENRVAVVESLQVCGSSEGIVRAHAGACPNPNVWMSDIEKARGYLDGDQLLIVSVAGVADARGSDASLVNDWVTVASMARDCGAPVIELSAGCPIPVGTERILQSDLRLLSRVCREIRRVVQDTPIVLKLGSCANDTLRSIVCATAKYVSGFAAISSERIVAVRRGAVGNDPAFGTTDAAAALSGKPLLPAGLRCVQALNELKSRAHYDYAIIGIGGVTDPHDVLRYLNSGADAVQAATVFFSDQLFGYKVWQFLQANDQSRKTVLEAQRQRAVAAAFAAHISFLEQGVRRGLHSATLEVLLEWETKQREMIARGPRLSVPVPSMKYFQMEIRRKLDAR